MTPSLPFFSVRAVTDNSDAKRKRQIGARVDEALLKEARILAIRQGRRFNDVVEESLRDLLKKYREKRRGGG